MSISPDIEAQTQALADQLQKLQDAQSDEDYIKELEIYNQMLKKADFSIEAQAAARKKQLTVADKVLAPPINKLTKQINKVNAKLIKHNNKKRRRH